jgi:hypothetical protein
MVVDLDRDMLYKFIGGLNSELFRNYARAELDRQPLNQPNMSVQQLAVVVAAFQQRKAQEIQSKIHAASMGSCSTAELEQLAREQRQILADASGGSEGASSSASAPSRGKWGQHVDDAAVKHGGTDPIKQEQLYQMVAQMMSDPKHPRALCSDHGLQGTGKRGKAHCNEDCPDKDEGVQH